MSSPETLQSALDYTFRDPSLLRLALTHPSVAHDLPAPTPHNQRVEFLGDAVLSLVLTHELYDRFPGCGEGLLTKARAQMVNRRSLAAEARQLHLGEHLILSHGEEASGGRHRQSALADAFEALVGAIFLDGGYDAAEQFILDHFRRQFGELIELPNLENPKGELQELLQQNSRVPPRYVQLSASGPDHDREFECAVLHDGKELGRGHGKSKKQAESAAAMAALEAERSRANKPFSPAEPGKPATPTEAIEEPDSAETNPPNP